MHDRELPEEEGVDDAVDGGRRANRDRQRHDTRPGGRRLTSDQAGPLAHVAPQGLERWKRALVLPGLFRLDDTAEIPPRGGPSVRGGQPSPFMFGSEQLQMRAHLLVEVVEAPGRVADAEQATYLREECAQAGHDLSASNRPTISTVRAQLSDCAASCFFPARVIV